jgi:hypothetical protein
MNIPDFTLIVDDVFEFGSGVTVFVGRVSGECAPVVLAPCSVELIVDGVSAGLVALTQERSFGASAGVRSLETTDPIAAGSIRGRCCLLVHRA